MRILYQIPTWLQRLYKGVVWREDTSSKVVFLTFDDGPILEVTPFVLDILNKYNVKATFFMVGQNAESNPDLLKRVINEGHRVGNHTFNHLKGLKTSTEDYLQNIYKAENVLNSANNLTLQTDKPLFRPPYGKMKTSQKYYIAKHFRIILWDVLTHDYNYRYTSERILLIVKKYTRNGSIINFHDSLKSRDNMLEALPKVIEYLQNQGFEFKTL